MNAPWKRPELEQRAPDRSIGGLLRSADHQRSGEVIAGVPMQTVSDAVVATVRLGYQVADRQIERGRRLTQQLRGAAARAGVDDPEAWVEQTERLLSKAMLAGSGWAEGALDADSPLMRLARAELKLLARWFGLRLDAGGASASDKPAPNDAAASTPAPPPPSPPPAPPPAPTLALRLLADDPVDRRAVRVLQAQWSALPADALPLWFHHRGVATDPLAGALQRVGGQDVLSLHTLRSHPAGAWRAAVCLPDGLQIGQLDIEL